MIYQVINSRNNSLNRYVHQYLKTRFILKNNPCENDKSFASFLARFAFLSNQNYSIITQKSFLDFIDFNKSEGFGLSTINLLKPFTVYIFIENDNDRKGNQEREEFLKIHNLKYIKLNMDYKDSTYNIENILKRYLR